MTQFVVFNIASYVFKCSDQVPSIPFIFLIIENKYIPKSMLEKTNKQKASSNFLRTWCSMTVHKAAYFKYISLQVNLHPSILPEDFDITPSGELVINLPTGFNIWTYLTYVQQTSSKGKQNFLGKIQYNYLND